VFTKLTSLARKFGFYTVSADHVPKKNVNKYVGSSCLNRRCVNTLFWSNSKAFKY